jgi:hypothetical protein
MCSTSTLLAIWIGAIVNFATRAPVSVIGERRTIRLSPDVSIDSTDIVARGNVAPKALSSEVSSSNPSVAPVAPS